MKEVRRSSRWASKKTRVLTAAALAAVTLTAVAFVAVGGAATGGTRTTAAAAQYGPTNTALPAISGQATEGQTLTVQPGTWTGAVPISYAYQWQRCDTAGKNCASIGGATGPTYVLQAADVGKTMRLVVTATNNEGSRSATSAQTAVVARVTTPSVLAVSAVSLPERLVIRGVQFQPSPIRSRAEPLIVRFRVTTTKGIPVSGALVFARGVPSNRVSSGAERATGADGWVEFTFQPLRALPLVRGATLVMFVRARKPNDDLLAGVSTRRLVQVRVNPSA